jgi:uncharacterized membrane protein
MARLIAGLLLFLGIHSVAILSPAWRDRMAARLGNGWRALYSLAALAGLVLLVLGYADARATPVVLYSPPPVLRTVALVLMLPVFPLLFAAYLPGRIRTRLKHPMLAGTKLWALAHLLANGTLADVLLFGGVLAWAVADRISLKRRPAREVRTAPPSRWNDLVAVVLGVAVYLLFLRYLHAALIGMPLLR